MWETRWAVPYPVNADKRSLVRTKLHARMRFTKARTPAAAWQIWIIGTIAVRRLYPPGDGPPRRNPSSALGPRLTRLTVQPAQPGAPRACRRESRGASPRPTRSGLPDTTSCWRGVVPARGVRLRHQVAAPGGVAGTEARRPPRWTRSFSLRTCRGLDPADRVELAPGLFQLRQADVAEPGGPPRARVGPGSRRRPARTRPGAGCTSRRPAAARSSSRR